MMTTNENQQNTQEEHLQEIAQLLLERHLLNRQVFQASGKVTRDMATHQLGQFIRAVREKRGLSRTQVARLTGLSEAKLLALEHGVIAASQIKAEWLDKLATILGEIPFTPSQPKTNAPPPADGPTTSPAPHREEPRPFYRRWWRFWVTIIQTPAPSASRAWPLRLAGMLALLLLTVILIRQLSQPARLNTSGYRSAYLGEIAVATQTSPSPLQTPVSQIAVGEKKGALDSNSIRLGASNTNLAVLTITEKLHFASALISAQPIAYQFTYSLSERAAITQVIQTCGEICRGVYQLKIKVGDRTWRHYLADSAPAYVNDLFTLEPAQTYLVQMTNPYTLTWLTMSGQKRQIGIDQFQTYAETPPLPTTLYGKISGSAVGSATSSTLEAQINGAVVAHTNPFIYQDTMVYVVKLPGENAGAEVTLRLNGQELAPRLLLGAAGIAQSVDLALAPISPLQTP